LTSPSSPWALQLVSVSPQRFACTGATPNCCTRWGSCATSAQQAAQIAAWQQERAVAAVNIVQLCGVVHAQQAQTAVRVPPPVQIWLN